MPPKIVIDTNVLVAGLRSLRGWSFDLLERIGTGQFQHVITVPLVMEYEDVLNLDGTLMATSNSPTCGQSNSPRQDG